MGKEVAQLLLLMPFPLDTGGSERMWMLLHVEIGWRLALAGSGAFASDLVMWCPNKFRSCCG